MEILITIIVLLLIFVIFRSMYENTHYEIERKTIYDSRIKNEIKVLFFADLHNNVYGKSNDKLLKDIEEFSPDIILIAGDLFVSKIKGKNQEAKNILKELIQKYKVIYTFGNHESKLRNKEKYMYPIDCLDEFADVDNLFLLNNDTINININSNELRILGYEADLKFYKKKKIVRPTIKDIEDALGKPVTDKNKIGFLLAHNPDFFDVYSKMSVDYIFSGHNHGGIVRLPFLGGIISTSYKLFPKYYGGEYKMNNTKMFVTRGLGSHTIRFRLFNKPEIHMYTFVNK